MSNKIELPEATKRRFDGLIKAGLASANKSNRAEFLQLKGYAIQKAVKLNQRYVRD